MTAREQLDAYAVGHEAGAIGCRGFNRRDHAPAAFAALRAVLDLHHPVDRGAGPNCAGCATHVTFTPYERCQTVAAITAALGAAQ